MAVRERLQALVTSLPDHVTLVAVTKTHPVEIILEAYEAGHRDMGENRVQELLSKSGILPKDIRWHLIGHLQTNKVKQIAPFIHLIHSVDSEKLLAEINKHAEKNNRIISCLLQVHVAEEETKSGFSTDEAQEFIAVEKWKQYAHVNVCGLMTMATFTENAEKVRAEFKKVKQLFDANPSAGFSILSMGMSSDYPIAVEEGSNMVRVGTAIFGSR